MKASIHKASGTPEDVEAITQIGRLAYEDSRYAGHVFAEQRVRDILLRQFRERPNTFGAWLVLRSGTASARTDICGCMLAMANDQIAVRGISCNTPLFYVHPDARTPDLARELIVTFRSWAQQQGAVDAMIHVTSGHRDAARIGQWLSRSGFDYIGDNFSKLI